MSSVALGPTNKETLSVAWPRRTEHGSTAWTLGRQMLQPQDGAVSVRTRVRDIGLERERLTQSAAGRVAAMEPEDARLTGGTRSLMRRLLGLNIGQAKPKGRQPAGSVVTVRPQVA
jgi:hypothetical protein